MLKAILKITFAVGIIYWLLTSGKLDLALISKSLALPHLWIITIGLLVLQDIISAVRWKLLLEIKSKKKFPSLKIIKLTWIGLFFSSVLPGAVTGDLIKLVYARDLDKDLDKTFLVMSALFDRVIGLIGLLSLLGFFSVLFYSDLVAHGIEMRNLIHFNFMLFLGAIAFIVTLFLPKKVTDQLVSIAKNIPILGKKISKTLDQVWIIGQSKKTVIKCLLMSILVQAFNVLAFWTITHSFYGKPFPLQYVFTFIPLGQMAVAVPISPAGLGVGHVIFDTLYSYVDIKGGASLFNLFFIAIISVNLMGVFPYILSGKKHSLDETSEFEES